MFRYKMTGHCDTDAVLSGLNEEDSYGEIEVFRRKAYIHELALALFHKNDGNIFGMLEDIRKNKPEGEATYVTAFERTTLIREFLALFPESDSYLNGLIFGAQEALAENVRGRILFVQNGYTEKACDRFIKAIPGSKQYAAHSFESLCEEIYSGNCEFGILPVDNSENGKLLHFFSLINKYDMKIAAVCDIKTNDSGVTRFALIRKDLVTLQTDCKSMLFELFITPERATDISCIISAAGFCSLTLSRIDSMRFSYREGAFTYCPVFETRNAEIKVFLLYMAVDYPQYTPIGLYPVIK